MSKYTDPRDFIMHIRAPLVAEYLKKHHKLTFDVPEEQEKSEDVADRFMAMMEGLKNEDLRDRIYMELEYINTLSSANHIDGLEKITPALKREKMEEACQNYDERALWAYTYHQRMFDYYHQQANIESMGVAFDLDLPKVVPVDDITDEMIKSFEPKVQKTYRAPAKGEKCKIKKYRDGKKLILRAYLDDLPTVDTVFVGDELDQKHLRNPTFDVIFIYNEDLKLLGVRAIGGKATIKELQTE